MQNKLTDRQSQARPGQAGKADQKAVAGKLGSRIAVWLYG